MEVTSDEVTSEGVILMQNTASPFEGGPEGDDNFEK
jgi:hypothetical protein